MRASSPMPAFVIVGCPRSGTTLVTQLASRLPGVSVSPETHLLRWLGDRPELIGSSADELLRRFRAGSDSEEIDALPIEDAITALRHRPRDLPAALAAWSSLTYASLGSEPTQPIIGEKTPDHLFWWRVLVQRDIKVVWVLRDPRAVLASRLEVPWGTRDPIAVGAHWRVALQELHLAERSAHDKLLLLRYESVVSDVEATAERLAVFLGAEPGLRPVVHQADGAAGPWWKARARGETTTDRIERWRTSLTASHVQTLEWAIGRRLLRSSMYPPETRWPAPVHLSTSSSALRARKRSRSRYERLSRVATAFGKDA